MARSARFGRSAPDHAAQRNQPTGRAPVHACRHTTWFARSFDTRTATLPPCGPPESGPRHFSPCGPPESGPRRCTRPAAPVRGSVGGSNYPRHEARGARHEARGTRHERVGNCPGPQAVPKPNSLSQLAGRTSRSGEGLGGEGAARARARAREMPSRRREAVSTDRIFRDALP